MEEILWNTGMMEGWIRAPFNSEPNIPKFHYSNIPFLIQYSGIPIRTVRRANCE
jgi:hypothetical protein